MRKAKRIALAACVVAVALVLVLIGVQMPVPAPDSLGLEDGDIILQDKLSPQSPAVSAATGSHYTHVGLVYRKPDGYYVIDASGSGVGERSFAGWVWRGIDHHITVIRYPGLNEMQRRQIIDNAKKYYGRAYDYYFSFDNDRIYCSELPYLAYREAGLSIGKVQQVKELNVNNSLVEALIRLRWKGSPYCQDDDVTYESCKKRIMAQLLVTPASLAADKKMIQVYSNF